LYFFSEKEGKTIVKRKQMICLKVKLLLREKAFRWWLDSKQPPAAAARRHRAIKITTHETNKKKIVTRK